MLTGTSVEVLLYKEFLSIITRSTPTPFCMQELVRIRALHVCHEPKLNLPFRDCIVYVECEPSTCYSNDSQMSCALHWHLFKAFTTLITCTMLGTPSLSADKYR